MLQAVLNQHVARVAANQSRKSTSDTWDLKYIYSPKSWADTLNSFVYIIHNTKRTYLVIIGAKHILYKRENIQNMTTKSFQLKFAAINF